jgi:hypothetical protein
MFSAKSEQKKTPTASREKKRTFSVRFRNMSAVKDKVSGRWLKISKLIGVFHQKKRKREEQRFLIQTNPRKRPTRLPSRHCRTNIHSYLICKIDVDVWTFQEHFNDFRASV